jgi:hypothetical protein
MQDLAAIARASVPGTPIAFSSIVATHTRPMPAIAPAPPVRAPVSRPARARATAERPPASQIPRLRAPIAPASAPRPIAPTGAAFASPLPSMLELSAATRAVAAEPTLAGALAALQRQACALTRSTTAAVVLFDGAKRIARTADGPITSAEFLDVVTRVASRGRREVFDDALVEPIGLAPSRAVLALWRPAARPFEPHDIALLAALVGGITATLHRLLAAG